MEQELNGLRIKLNEKNEIISYTIKKIPVLLGSGKGKNIFPLRGHGVEAAHGAIELKGKNLVYTDISNSGSVLNNVRINRKSASLKPGSNLLEIGNAHISIENETEYTSNKQPGLSVANKSIIIGSTTLLFVVLLLIIFFKTRTGLEISDIKLSSETINIYDNHFSLDSILFKDNAELKVDKKYRLIVLSKSGEETDSVTIQEYKAGQKVELKIPSGLKNNALGFEKDVLVTVRLENEDKGFICLYNKKIPAIAFERTIKQGDVSLYLKVTNQMLLYRIDSRKTIKKVEIQFGDKYKSDKKEGTRLYFEKGNYDFVVKVQMDKSRNPEIIKQKISIKN